MYTGSQPAGHPSGGRLPLLSARPAFAFPAAEHHRPLAGTKLYCLVTEAHRCEQLTQGCYAAFPRLGFEPETYRSQDQRSTRCAIAPPLNKRLNFGSDPDHRLDTGIVFRIRHYWEIRKVV